MTYMTYMTSEFIKKGILGGVCIGLGAHIFLTVGGLMGAIMFSIGLLSVVHFEALLYTGKIQEFPTFSYEKLTGVFVLNMLGCILLSLILNNPETAQKSVEIISARLDTSWSQIIAGSIGCGFIMTVAVSASKEKNFWPLLIGVPAFITAGMYHSVADTYYWISSAGIMDFSLWISYVPKWLFIIFGNFVGGQIAPRLTS